MEEWMIAAGIAMFAAYRMRYAIMMSAAHVLFAEGY